MPAPPGPAERGALAAAGLAPLAAAPSRRPASKFVRLLGRRGEGWAPGEPGLASRRRAWPPGERERAALCLRCPALLPAAGQVESAWLHGCSSTGDGDEQTRRAEWLRGQVGGTREEGRTAGEGADLQARSRPVPDGKGKVWGAGTCLGTAKEEKWVSPGRREGQRAEWKASVS